MHSKPEGMMDGSAPDVRDVRMCACRTQTVLKKASCVYDGKTRSGFRGGNRALRAPLIGYEAYGTHRAEKSRVGANVGRGQRRECEREGLLHCLHCLDIVGELCVGYVKIGIYKTRGRNCPPSKKHDEIDDTEEG